MTTESSRDTHRIAKLLARAGVASRREVERMIDSGRVALNGVVIDTPATILPSLAGVTVDGAPVQAPEPTRLFVFHKPPGLLTAAFDPKGRPTIYDRLPRDLPRVMPVGRLDLNTEGLLLLTTDGEFKRQLELPATGVERSYRARAYGQISQAQLEDLITGVEIEGIRYGPIDANLERRTGANVWIEMTLSEGKNREVRRVLEYLGLEVSRLIRTRYGPFILGDLPPGEVGEVKQHDLVGFRKALKLPVAQRPDDRAGPVVSAPIRKRAPMPPKPVPLTSPVEPQARLRVARPVAPRKREVREEIETQADRATRAARPARAPISRKPDARTDGLKTARTDARPDTRRSTRPDARPDTRPATPARTQRPVRAPAPRAIDQRPAPARPTSPAAPIEDAARPPRAKKGAGWAKAKPKPHTPGKPKRRP